MGTIDREDMDDMEDKEWFDPLPRELMSLFYFICLIYIGICFYVLAKHFIIPSLDIVMAKTGATDSVAGILIYGGATSLLGFTTATIGAFVDVPDNMSTNKTLGGNIYELSFVVAISIFNVPSSLLKALSVRAFLRDIVFVVICTILVFLIFMDSTIVWYEAVLPVAIFLLYLVTVRVLRRFMTDKIIKLEPIGNPMGSEPEAIEVQGKDEPDPTKGTLSLTTAAGTSCCEKFSHVISLPAKIPFMLTIPSPIWKCCEARWMSRLYPLTLVVSFIWLGVLSYFMIIIATDFGRLVGLPAPITGLLIGPISLELMSSILLAKRGDLAIAVHAILGRAIINICLTFSIPTLLYNIIFGENLQVSSKGSLYSLIMMVLTIIVLILEVTLSNGKLRKYWGIPPLLLFVLHLVAAIALTYGFIVLPFLSF